MAKEIERKFLVNNESYLETACESIPMCQFYLSNDKNATIRIRICGQNAFLTIKGVTHGCIRDEWEYSIPLRDAMLLKGLSRGGMIEKTRYIVVHDSNRWEIDRFHGKLEGLVVAEIELKSENQPFSYPDFIGEEVTGDPQYYNSNLSLLKAPPKKSQDILD